MSREFVERLAKRDRAGAPARHDAAPERQPALVDDHHRPASASTRPEDEVDPELVVDCVDRAGIALGARAASAASFTAELPLPDARRTTNGCSCCPSSPNYQQRCCFLW